MPVYPLKKALCLFTAMFCAAAALAQNTEEHNIVLNNDPQFTENQHFKQGSNKDPQGKVLDLNNYYLRIDGKPVLPVMGEFHYSRYPRAEWEQAILQMKAAGINVIAFYCFWLHHEQEEGHYRFDDNLDVRYFIQLCAKHGLKAVARIGPWAHGEARNGGMPDWFVKKKMKSGFDRVTKNGSIEPEVAAWYKTLAKQFEGLYYKDGGPLIGVQVDNEMRSNGPGSAGYEYLRSLKKLAVDDGIDVPLYVVTGWPGPQVPEDDVLPLWGGYPDAPWTQNTKDLPPNNIYTFNADRKDKNIGNDVLTDMGAASKTPLYRHPFLTVELGGGMQITYHRRPTLQAGDLLALDYTRLGAGANMLGYYVFHGTQHPLSWHQEYTTQESKSTIYPYPNDYPMISYDFEAPITEWGYLRDYYHDFKLLHQFINSYGPYLAPMAAQIPAENPTKADNLTDLRYTIRSRAGAGFIFFNNYVRHYDLAAHPNVVFNIKTDKGILRIPQSGSINISNKVYGAIPFNYNMDGVLLKYATAHPSTILDNPQGKVYCYYAMDGVKPQFAFDASSIQSITTLGAKQSTANGTVVVDALQPGENCLLSVTPKSGKAFKVLVLTKDEARYSYVFNVKGVKTLLLSNLMVYYDDVTGKFTMRSVGQASFGFKTYPAIAPGNSAVQTTGTDGIFTQYTVTLPQWQNPGVTFKQISADTAFKRYTQGLAGNTPTGPTYKMRFDAQQPFKAYQISLPAAMPKNVYDVLLNFNYQGNTASLYANGLIVADDYYTGIPMPYSLKRHQELLGKQTFVLQITPLMDNYAIHFEPGTTLGFAKSTHAELLGIQATPCYEVVF